jgi:hypothetical protein
MWPVTITIGVLMTIAVLLFLAFSFVLIYGVAFLHLPEWLDPRAYLPAE